MSSWPHKLAAGYMVLSLEIHSRERKSWSWNYPIQSCQPLTGILQGPASAPACTETGGEGEAGEASPGGPAPAPACPVPTPACVSRLQRAPCVTPPRCFAMLAGLTGSVWQFWHLFWMAGSVGWAERLSPSLDLDLSAPVPTCFDLLEP